eukprot:352596-Chlamydomonas_euryale.AAC.1
MHVSKRANLGNRTSPVYLKCLNLCAACTGADGSLGGKRGPEPVRKCGAEALASSSALWSHRLNCPLMRTGGGYTHGSLLCGKNSAVQASLPSAEGSSVDAAGR